MTPALKKRGNIIRRPRGLEDFQNTPEKDNENQDYLFVMH